MQKVHKMCSVRSVYLLLLAVVASTQGANILGLFSSHSQSHLIIHMSVAKTLAEAGHNVTVVAMMQPQVMHKNITLIVIPVTDEQERVVNEQMAAMAGQKNSIFSTMHRLLNGLDVMIQSQGDLLSDPRFHRIYETKFDLMILGYFNNDFHLGVANKLKVPVIVDWLAAPMSAINRFTGNPSELSYVPIISAATHPMSLRARAANLFKHLFMRYIASQMNAKVTRIYRDNFANEKDQPTLNELRKNISMAFVNCHLISEGPIRPMVPGLVEIGGIHIKDKADPLPQEFEKFLSKSSQGAILLSLGSNIKSSAVKPEIVQTIFKVLSGLKQNVIWKWEDLENTPGNAPNILYKKWLPQDDILAHPNTKLFITHAGRGGITEAQYHGVPMVALPVFGDQPGNAEIMQKAGYGLSLDLLTITEDSLGEALNEVIQNEKYSHAVGKFSSLYRDRPMTAKQSVIYWTEYILRHHGAPHLQSPAVHMTFVQLYNLDLYVILLTILSLSIFLLRLLVKFVWNKLGGQKKSYKKQKKL